MTPAFHSSGDPTWPRWPDSFYRPTKNLTELGFSIRGGSVRAIWTNRMAPMFGGHRPISQRHTSPPRPSGGTYHFCPLSTSAWRAGENPAQVALEAIRGPAWGWPEDKPTTERVTP